MTIRDIATQLVANGKGLLAADESTSTIQKRFDAIGITNTEANRQAYRELLFTTPTVEQHISGVILYDETIRQSTRDGVAFTDLLREKGVLIGIKVDLGKEPLSPESKEEVTIGLDDLDMRLTEYAQLGAQFTKWRAVITIGTDLPTDAAIRENAVRLAAYAKAVQAAGMVPIVEPEVLMEGSHTLRACKEATLRAQYALFEELERIHVDLSAVILKPNFVVPGTASTESFDAARSAKETLDVLGETVPVAVPGIMFLSGGLSEEQATDVLREINSLDHEHAWELSFSYGRALQQSALAAWQGKDAQVSAAQEAFLTRAKQNHTAALGN